MATTPQTKAATTHESEIVRFDITDNEEIVEAQVRIQQLRADGYALTAHGEVAASYTAYVWMLWEK